MIAPDLLAAECANILWKKVRRGEFLREEARLAARLLQAAEIELTPTRSFLGAATRIAIELDHSAFDCLYLALAVDRNCRFVIVDQPLLRKLREGDGRRFRDPAASLAEAAESDGVPRDPP
jgi:predicted nucleic acid-binding protein